MKNSRDKVIKLYNDCAETKQVTGLKMVTPKQMLQRLPIALAQVKAVSNSEHLLNEIRQIVCSMYQSKNH